jgi:hypothetical protein
MNSTTAVNLIMCSRESKHVVQISICSVHFVTTVVKQSNHGESHISVVCRSKEMTNTVPFNMNNLVIA